MALLGSHPEAAQQQDLRLEMALLGSHPEAAQQQELGSHPEEQQDLRLEMALLGSHPHVAQQQARDLRLELAPQSRALRAMPPAVPSWLDYPATHLRAARCRLHGCHRSWHASLQEALHHRVPGQGQHTNFTCTQLHYTSTVQSHALLFRANISNKAPLIVCCHSHGQAMAGSPDCRSSQCFRNVVCEVFQPAVGSRLRSHDSPGAAWRPQPRSRTPVSMEPPLMLTAPTGSMQSYPVDSEKQRCSPADSGPHAG